MLSTTAGGEGAIIFSHFLREKRHPTFLSRNLMRCKRYRIRMGSPMSRLVTAALGTRQRDVSEESEDEAEFDEERPMKRRKIDATADDGNIALDLSGSPNVRSPLDQLTNGSRRPTPLRSKPPPVSPGSFYGKPKTHTRTTGLYGPSKTPGNISRSITNFVDRVSETGPVDFQKALKIDVLGIFTTNPVDSDIIASLDTTHYLDIKCRCTAAIFYRVDNHGSAYTKPGPWIQITQKKQMGLLRVAVDSKGELTRRLLLSETFTFAAAEIFISRRKLSQPEQARTFDLADAYMARVSIEPVGYQPQWPSIHIPSPASQNEGLKEFSISDLLDKGTMTKNDLDLYCKFNLLDGWTQSPNDVPLSIGYQDQKQRSEYKLRLDVSWSIPKGSSKLACTADPPLQSPVPNASRTVPESTSPVASKMIDTSVDATKETRSYRPRSSHVDYNLKSMSAKAQGKLPRKSKPKIPRPTLAGPAMYSITYCFGKADSLDNKIKQQHTYLGLKCPFCRRDHVSVDELRFHLQGAHSNYKFWLRQTHPNESTYFVNIVKKSSSLISEPPRTIQIGKNRTLFDLERYLNGDDSWIRAREGPLHNQWPEHLRVGHEPASSSSPRDSRASSPNTTDSLNEVAEPDSSTLQLPPKPRKALRVPKTSKPLYDTVTKKVLKPGEIVPDSDDELNESWFHQKHRDIINDYTDVSSDEKDYINQWNPYVLGEQLSNQKYLPDAALRFVENNKTWFSERDSRRIQFVRQMETFILRGIMDQDQLHKCLDILRLADRTRATALGRSIAQPSEKDAAEEPKSQSALSSTSRGLLQCICGQHTAPNDRVVCRGQDCRARFWHKKCSRSHGEYSRPGFFTCNSCKVP